MVSRTFFELCLTLGSVGQLLCPGAEWQISRVVRGSRGKDRGGTFGEFSPSFVYSA